MNRFGYLVNWPRMLFAAMYYVLENNYFGWNRYPQSPEECIADGFIFLLLALSYQRRGGV